MGTSRLQEVPLALARRQIRSRSPRATATAIERDFSMASQMLSPRRSTLDAVYIEILMYLNLNLDLIPNFTPTIHAKEAHRYLPARLQGIDDLDRSIFPSAEEIRRDSRQEVEAEGEEAEVEDEGE